MISYWQSTLDTIALGIGLGLVIGVLVNISNFRSKGLYRTFFSSNQTLPTTAEEKDSTESSADISTQQKSKT